MELLPVRCSYLAVPGTCRLSARACDCASLQAQGVRGDRSWQAAACGLLLTALLACALPEASGFRRLSAAGNYTDDWEDAAEAAQNVTGPLALLHPRLVVFGDSISSIRGTSKIVRKALRLTHLVRVQAGPAAPPSTVCSLRCLHADSTATCACRLLGQRVSWHVRGCMGMSRSSSALAMVAPI